MAAADKARFHLERSVPQLQELSKKGVFSNGEITAIVKKRSDFEHVLNGPGSKPTDYIRYVAYEMNLDALRKKRCLRLGIKSTTFNGQKNVFYIFERATKKFPGDKRLWSQYIQYCQKEQANKKLARVFTSALRLAPRDCALWIVAAKHYAESQGDMASARAYLQRGIRFCADEQRLYLEYAKLELVYLAKLSARRKLLGLDEEAVPDMQAADENEDTIALPTITAEEFDAPEDKTLEHLNTANLERLAKAPVMKGAVPIAIFDAAMTKFARDAALAERFYRLSLEFDAIEPVVKFQEHALSSLELHGQPSAELFICTALQHIANARAQPADYPEALGNALNEIRTGERSVSAEQSSNLALKAVLLFLSQLQKQPEQDEDLKTVLVASIRRYVRSLLAQSGLSSIDAIVRKLQKLEPHVDASRLHDICGAGDIG